VPDAYATGIRHSFIEVFMKNQPSSRFELSQWSEQFKETLHTPDNLVSFVNTVGCCTSKILPAYPSFPNQQTAMGTIDPNVPDPWFWKDDMHTEKRLYYTRVFGGQPGYVSLSLLPALMATNGAVFDELVYQGQISPDVQQIYQAIESYGPISTKKLKKLLTPEAQRIANRVLVDLDRKFLITKTDISGRTMGTYSYVWNLVERWMPESLEAADRLGQKQAAEILKQHLSAFDILPDSPFYTKVLGWKLLD
jgi:hypothetical protein